MWGWLDAKELPKRSLPSKSPEICASFRRPHPPWSLSWRPRVEDWPLDFSQVGITDQKWEIHQIWCQSGNSVLGKIRDKKLLTTAVLLRWVLHTCKSSWPRDLRGTFELSEGPCNTFGSIIGVVVDVDAILIMQVHQVGSYAYRV